MQSVTSDNPGSWDSRHRNLPPTKHQSILVILGLLPAILVATLANNLGIFKGNSVAGEQRYADVPSNSPYYTPAERFTALGLVTGYPCGQSPQEPCDEKQRPYFRWGESVKRKELARLLVMADDARDAAGRDRSADLPAGTQTYADVPPTHFHYRWIEETARRAFMRDYPCGGASEPCDERNRPYFHPDTAALRSELALGIYQADQRIRNNPTVPRTVSFQDVPEDHPFWLYIERVYELGVMTGYVCGACSPSEPCVPPNSRSYFRPNAPANNGQVARALTNWSRPKTP